MHTHTHSLTYIHTHIHTHSHTLAHTYICIRTHTNSHTDTGTLTLIHTLTLTDRHTGRQTYTDTDVKDQDCSLFSLWALPNPYVDVRLALQQLGQSPARHLLQVTTNRQTSGLHATSCK